MVELVAQANHLDFDALAETIMAARSSWEGVETP